MNRIAAINSKIPPPGRGPSNIKDVFVKKSHNGTIIYNYTIIHSYAPPHCFQTFQITLFFSISTPCARPNRN